MPPSAYAAARVPETPQVSSPDHVIYVVDDERSVRDSLYELLSSLDRHVITFSCATDYIVSVKADLPACLVLDIELPDINGLELQRQLSSARHPPIVFISGHGDVPSTVRAIKAGAIDFLPKPFGREALLNAIDAAIARDRLAIQAHGELTRLRERHALLTSREREAFTLVVSGMLNKQAAAVLGISEVTMQVHRGKVMHKMGAQSFADLIRMAERLGIPVGEAHRLTRGPNSPHL